MKEIQYGVIGCGKHALKTHAIPNQQIAEFALAGVYDLSDAKMNLFIDKVNNPTPIQKFKTREQLLQSGIGAVLIGTPDDCHFDDLSAAVQSGKHVFIEKPLAVNPAELEALPDVLQEATQNGLVISSCHPRRYDPPYMWLKNHLPELLEDFGQAMQVNLDFSYHQPTQDWKHERSLLLDHANHETDLVNYLFGHSGFDATRLIDSYDRYQIAGMRDDGISFGFSGTRRLHNRTYPEWATIRFESGEVTVDTHKGFARIIDHETGQEHRQPVPVTDYEARGAATMKNFGQTILGLAEPYLSPQDVYVNTALSVKLTTDRTWRYDM